MQVMLFGGSDSYSDDEKMQITVAFNHFGQGLVQRMPRCRWGLIHVVNNDYTHWLMYAIGGSQHPTILSQGNRFIAPNNAACKEVRYPLFRDCIHQTGSSQFTSRLLACKNISTPPVLRTQPENRKVKDKGAETPARLDSQDR